MKNIVIVGGGTAGWLTAVHLLSSDNPLEQPITLIESEDIFDLFRTLSEEHFNNHKKFYNKEFKYQDKENE